MKKILFFIMCAAICCILNPMSAKADEMVNLYKGETYIGQYGSIAETLGAMTDSSGNYVMKLEENVMSGYELNGDWAWPKVKSLKIQGDNTVIGLEGTHTFYCDVMLEGVLFAVNYGTKGHVIDILDNKLTLHDAYVGYWSDLDEGRGSSSLIGAKGSVVEVIGEFNENGMLECKTQVDKIVLKSGRLWFCETTGEHKVSQLEVHSGEIKFGEFSDTTKCKVTIDKVVNQSKDAEVLMIISNSTVLQIGDMISSTGTAFPIRLEYRGDTEFPEIGKVTNSSLTFSGTMKNVSEIIVYYISHIRDKKTSFMDLMSVNHVLTAKNYRGQVKGEYYHVHDTEEYNGVGHPPLGNGTFSLHKKDGAYYVDYDSFRGTFTDDTIYYMKNGKIDYSYTGVIDGCYVKNGVFDESYTGFANSGKDIYWVLVGRIYDITGVRTSGNKSYYLKNGKVDTSYTGAFPLYENYPHYEKLGIFYFVKNGVANDKYTGLGKYNNIWYYLEKGTWSNWYTGLAKYNGSWWYVANGKLNFGYTGLCKYNGSWWYVKNGKVDFGYTGLCKYNGSWWYIKSGKLDFGYTGLCKYNGSWWYIKSGKLDFGYTGLCKYNGSWWYVKKGILDFTYTGLCKHGGSWYYVQKGILNWNYTGLCKYGSTWYYVQKGVLNWNYTGLCKYDGSWYYVQKGVLNFGYTGLCKYGGSWYYVQKGVLNWNYTGYSWYGGSRWYVKSGVMKYKA